MNSLFRSRNLDDSPLLKPNFWSSLTSRLEAYGSYFRCLRRDPRWGAMFFFGRFPWGRSLGSWFHRQPLAHESNSSPESLNSSIFENLDVELACKSLQKDGCFVGIRLPASIAKEMLDYAYSADISIDGNPNLSFKYHHKDQAEQQYDRQILIGNYLAVNSECLAVKQLADDPKLLAIATKYLGREPMLVRSQMGWTFIGNKQDYAQKGEIGSPTTTYHYDLDDYRAIKFFFYLTDVDSTSGSHRYVAGSHKRRKLSHYIFRGQTDQQIVDYYGSSKIINICGSAGLGFAEDPFCFHRGTPPLTEPRLMIQIEFTFNDYGMWEL